MIINNSQKAFQVLSRKFNAHQEEVWVLCLNNDLRLLCIEMLFRGTVSECILHPRDLIRLVCSKNSSCFVLAHNHPSGQVKPSSQDQKVTKRISQISSLIQVPMTDHVIFSATQYFSFADKKIICRSFPSTLSGRR